MKMPLSAEKICLIQLYHSSSAKAIPKIKKVGFVHDKVVFILEKGIFRYV